MKKIRNAVVFLLLFVLLLNGSGLLFQPVWIDWANYDTKNEFYNRPDNTIETIFVGASIVDNAFIPSE